MNAMTMIAASLGLLDRCQAENAVLRDFVEDVAHTYEIADIDDRIERATELVKGWQ